MNSARNVASTLAVAALAVAIAACSLSRQLSTWHLPANRPVACNEALLEGTLAGDTSDARLAWVETPNGRVDVDWPPGFTAVFDPALRIMSPDGLLIAKAGDRMQLGGSFGDAGAWLACDVNGTLFVP